MKYFYSTALPTLLACALLMPVTPAMAQQTPSNDACPALLQHSFLRLQDEKPQSLCQYRGKVLLVVNTASYCGFTGQYKELEALHARYQSKGLVVLGFPSNDFSQESGSNQEIAAFCQLNFGVSFPMAAKEIVSGDNAHPFYQWARKTLGFGTAPKWNFHKYLIDRDGKLIDYFYSTTSPNAHRVHEAIEKLLAKE